MNGKNEGGGGGVGGRVKGYTVRLRVTLTATPMLNLSPKATIFSIQMKLSSILMSDIIDYQKWSQQNYY